MFYKKIAIFVTIGDKYYRLFLQYDIVPYQYFGPLLFITGIDVSGFRPKIFWNQVF